MADTGYISEQQRKQWFNRISGDAAFFAENMLNDEFGEPYVLEPYQKQYLRCPAKKKHLFWGRRLSKSLMLKIESMHKTMFNRAYRALIVSPTMEQAIYFGEDINDLIDATPAIQPMFLSTKSTKFKLKNNSRMYMATAGRGGAAQLGKNALYLAFDETQIIPEETFTSLRPTLRGQKREKNLVYAGTPLARLNEFYRAYDNGQFYITIDGVYKGTGTSRDFVVFERPTCELNPDGTPKSSTTNRISLEELLDDFRDMPLTGFLREYCLQWMDSVGEVFSQDLLQRAIRWDDMPEDTCENKCVMGLDVGKQRNSSVLTIGKLNGYGVDIINIIEWPLTTPYHEVAQDIANLQPDYPNTELLVMDETGVGKGVIEIVEKKMDNEWKSLDVQGFDFSGGKKKTELVEAGVTDLEQGSATLIFNQKLYNEMCEFKREITSHNNIVYRKPQGGSDDFVDSLLLTLYGARDFYGWNEDSSDVVTTGDNILAQSGTRVSRVPI